MWRGISIPQWMLLASFVAYAATFGLLETYGRPGLGISGGFYVAVILAAAATSPVSGALAGLAAIVLFELAIHHDRGLALVDFDNAAALTHLAGFMAAGLVTGFLALRVRRMLAQSLYVLEDLIEIAHDRQPGLAPAFTLTAPDPTD
jgi:K+-sensing histidine kinase KdpD